MLQSRKRTRLPAFAIVELLQIKERDRETLVCEFFMYDFQLFFRVKAGGRDSVTGRSGKRLRGLLVTAEVAVSLVLLIARGC